MAIPLLIEPRVTEFRARDSAGRLCIVPRDTRNAEFALATDFRTQNIYFTERYSAFPYTIQLGSSIVGIFSEGMSHANSDKQILYRSDDFGRTYMLSDFWVKATGVLNANAIADLIPEGSTILLKVWAVSKIGGVLVYAPSQPEVVVGSLTYSLWSRPKQKSDGTYIRTGYANTGTATQCALFTSLDLKTWTFSRILFAEAGKFFSEADMGNTGGQNWYVVCREDSGANNPLYILTTTDDFANISSATVMAGFTGRQPNITYLAGGGHMLAVGDRTGSSGASSAGDTSNSSDRTGVGVWFRSPAGLWSQPTMVAYGYSTDEGQPYGVEVAPGRVVLQYYARRSLLRTAGIGSVAFNYASL